MGTPWCLTCQRVTVKRGETPKRFTIVLPYYDNPEFLRFQVAHWLQFPKDIRQHLAAIIVDDGSPMPAVAALQGITHPFSLRLFRIEQDVRWNWLAARNLGAHHAADGWLLMTDMDHVIPATTAYALIYGQHDPKVVYAFTRKEHTGQEITPHSASFFLTREMFWKIGGYDETFSGLYGTDGLYRRRLAQTAPIQILPETLIRHEYQGDSSTRTYKRKQPQDAEVRKIAARLPPKHKPKTLSFAAHEVAL